MKYSFISMFQINDLSICSEIGKTDETTGEWNITVDSEDNTNVHPFQKTSNGSLFIGDINNPDYLTNQILQETINFSE